MYRKKTCTEDFFFGSDEEGSGSGEEGGGVAKEDGVAGVGDNVDLKEEVKRHIWKPLYHKYVAG